MLTVYKPGLAPLEVVDLSFCAAAVEAAFWIDAFNPTADEEQALESALGLDVPTRLEMQEIEATSRLYVEGNALIMTATVLCKADTDMPESSPFTFILTPEKLVTLRYNDAAPIRGLRSRIAQGAERIKTSDKALEFLVNSFIDLLADTLEAVGAKLDAVSRAVFASSNPNGTKSSGSPDFYAILRQIGRLSDLLGRARESLVSFGRLNSFWADAKVMTNASPEGLHHAKAVGRDIVSLTDHATFLSGKVNFLLDATLGFINVEQNAIIKIFSILAVVFLPPTLVGTIYGMNFEGMPELKWPFGYPLAIFLMIVSGVVPYLYFKRKGWH